MAQTIRIPTDDGEQYVSIVGLTLISQATTTTVIIQYLGTITTVTHTAIAAGTFTVRDAIQLAVNDSGPGIIANNEIYPRGIFPFDAQLVLLPPGVTVSTIISECCGATPPPVTADTIYTADDTIAGNRNVDIDSFELEFTNGKVGFGTGGGLLSCAVVEFQSNTEGILLPRMSGPQVEAIVGPINGLVAYADSAGAGDITGLGFWGYNGTNWCQLDNCTEGDQESIFPAIDDNIDIDFDTWDAVEITLPNAVSTNEVQAPVGGNVGQLYVIEIKNINVAVVTWVGEWRFAGGVPPVITTLMGAGNRDVLVFAKISAGFAFVSHTADC